MLAIDGGGPVVVHAQPAPADTLNVPFPPDAGIVADCGLSVKVHGSGAATTTVTGTASNTFAESGAFAATTPLYVPIAREATFRFRLSVDEVVPEAAESVAPGIPVTIAVKGRLPLVEATLIGTGAGAGDPVV
jgi:hypothetical protein